MLHPICSLQFLSYYMLVPELGSGMHQIDSSDARCTHADANTELS